MVNSWFQRIAILTFGLGCTIFPVLMGHANQEGKSGTFQATPSSTSAVISLPRGISGLELGMAPADIRPPFKIKKDEDPLAVLLTKYGKPEQGKAVAQKNEALQKEFFRIFAEPGAFPEGVSSSDARAFHNVIYQIGLHYSEASVKRNGWRGIVAPYLAKCGKPSEDTGSAYIWDDGRTHLDIESSGDIINVFFTDKALEIEVKKAERERP
jgi:hypothetical protein